MPESQTVAETLASNVRAFRLLRELEQEKLARRMQWLGHQWRQATVSEVERGRRSVTVPELVALTLALAATVEQLLDPRGPEQRRGPLLALQEPRIVIPKDTASTDLQCEVEVDPERVPVIQPDHVTALLCSHKTYVDVVWEPDWQYIEKIDLVDDRPDLTDVGPEGVRS